MMPTSWAPQADDDAERNYRWWRRVQMVDLDKRDSKWAEVEGMLKSSVPSASLVKLQLYQCRHTWHTYGETSFNGWQLSGHKTSLPIVAHYCSYVYCACCMSAHKREMLGLKNGGDPSERLLWHGTRYAVGMLSV
jgi:hypothetical protein